MAFLFTREVKDYHEDLQCPICLDDFKEPKLLDCSHSLCRKCIEDLSKSANESRFINCPLCRAKTKIPQEGAKKLPKNTKLEKLLKEAPATRARKEIQDAIQECGLSLEKTKDISKRLNKALEHEGGQLKHRIHEVCENIIDLIRKQTKQLCQDVDRYASSQQESHPAALLVSKTENLTKDIENALKHNDSQSIIKDKDVFIQHLAEAKIAASRIQQVYHDLPEKTSTVEFHRNRQVFQCLSSTVFGSITFKNASRKATGTSIINRGLTSDLEIIKPGTRFRSLHVPSKLESKFQPFAIASNDEGKISVSCHGTHSILLYNENGEFCQTIGRRGSGKGELECPTGVNFLSPHILAVADGCLFGNPSRLQAFDTSGRFVRCLTQLPKNTHWFTQISILNSQQVIITCNHVALEYESYVQVINTDGAVALAFGATGEGKLNSPVKAIFLNNEYFVSDYDKSSNCCMIKVFDDKGRYLRSFGDCMLKGDIEDHPSHPLVITADPWTGLILSYSGLFKVIRCYKPDGSLVSYHGTISGIIDMVLTKDRRLFVICDGSGEFPHSIQVLFHT